MGPSQEAKGSPWRQASSSSSCLERTGSSKASRQHQEAVEKKCGCHGNASSERGPVEAAGWTHFFLLRRSLSAGPSVPVLLMAMGSPEAWSSEGVDANQHGRDE